ncbi:MAG TPA: aldose epimerase family protein, partial [Sunxiuqinia sp.]|nr:aldose epimerase family protein [Sunxiuqinia sp.]
AEEFENDEEVGLKMTYTSTNGEEGYPGKLKVTCIYSLNNDNELSIKYEAETDEKTIVNFTNHSYFNLTGGEEQILDHELLLKAKKITESADLIPTGKILPVEGTPFDFTKNKKLGQDIETLPDGYDQNYVLDNDNGRFVFVGRLKENSTGREMEVYTTQPGIQLYTGYWIPELIVDGEKKFGRYSGVALETQHYPDSPNHPDFPSTELKPGQKYLEQTVYKFGISED